MAYSEDHIVLAAEYALGTLDVGERGQVQTMMAVDTDFAAICEAWEYRLSVLNQMVGLVEPRAEVWERIKAAITRPAPAVTEPVRLEPAELLTSDATPDIIAVEAQAPETAAAPMDAETVSETSDVPALPDQPAPEQTSQDQEPPPVSAEHRSPAASDESNVIQLASKVRQWRTVANAMTALAAVLLAMITVQVYRPDLLPDALRTKPRPQGSQLAAQFVALLQKDSASPAFILTVDAASKNFTVRKVGAEAEPGKSYELWLVSDKLQAPRSLGVIGGGDFTARPVLSSYDADTVNGATYAVSVEPEGGSPTGAVTGPIVFSGKLIETVPDAAPAR